MGWLSVGFFEAAVMIGSTVEEGEVSLNRFATTLADPLVYGDLFVEASEAQAS